MRKKFVIFFIMGLFFYLTFINAGTPQSSNVGEIEQLSDVKVIFSSVDNLYIFLLNI